MTKVTYERNHLIGACLQIQMVQSVAVMVAHVAE